MTDAEMAAALDHQFDGPPPSWFFDTDSEPVIKRMLALLGLERRPQMQKFLITIWFRTSADGKRVGEHGQHESFDAPVIAESAHEAELVVAARLGEKYNSREMEIEVVPFAKA